MKKRSESIFHSPVKKAEIPSSRKIDSDPVFSRLSIVGLGLIGGSIALGVKQRGLPWRVTAHDTDPDALDLALKAGAIDRAAGSLEETCEGADLIILAVPVLGVPPLAMKIHGLAGPRTVLTDVGSTKESVVKEMEALGDAGPRFVGGHPIAGTENSGFRAARGDLFENAPFILTPTGRTDAAAARTVELFWKALGCRIHRLSPAEHDRLFALISHLPHLAAYALVGAVLAGVGDSGTVRDFSGGGFRDFTRVAASDPVMWRDICLDNRTQLLHALDLYLGELSFMRDALAGGDGGTLENIFRKSRNMKKST